MESEGASSRNSPIFEILSSSRRRRILRLICRQSATSVDDLAVSLVAEEHDKPRSEVTDLQTQSLRTSLIHVHLPALEAADLVVWNEGEETVRPTDHPVFQDPTLDRIVGVEGDDWDEVLESLANKRRRIVLSILEDRQGPTSVTDLASEVAAYESETAPDSSDETARSLIGTLRHVHLPKIERAGLAEYDREAGTCTYVGHPALDEEWLDFPASATPRAILTDAEQAEDVWRLDGRDQVIERGRALTDYAVDELFVMITTDGLVEETCLRRIRAAVDRGVDVYFGSRSRDLRESVRDAAPGVTLWEPQVDWLNASPEREKVGRLVLADRETIMLGTLGEKPESDLYEETAITCTGSDKALVILVREMLASHLDHVDAESAGPLSGIPL